MKTEKELTESFIQWVGAGSIGGAFAYLVLGGVGVTHPTVWQTVMALSACALAFGVAFLVRVGSE